MTVALDACTAFCAAAGDTLGPVFAEVLFGIGGAALVWWRSRKMVQAVETKLVAQNVELGKAKEEARVARREVAEVRGSMRPMQSQYTPVVPRIEPIVRESMPDPSLLADELPGPPAVPSFDSRETHKPPRRS
jgi:hypothetical protein